MSYVYVMPYITTIYTLKMIIQREELSTGNVLSLLVVSAAVNQSPNTCIQMKISSVDNEHPTIFTLRMLSCLPKARFTRTISNFPQCAYLRYTQLKQSATKTMTSHHLQKSWQKWLQLVSRSIPHFASFKGYLLRITTSCFHSSERKGFGHPVR